MAEGGFDEFENPAFDRDDYGYDGDDILWCLMNLIRELFQIRMIVLLI